MEMTSSDGASVEPVNGDVPSSTGRKGKRHLVSDDDLQPTPKKTYNLRNRKSKFSEEEVATHTPLSNRRTGKRLAESDSGFQVTSKKPYYSRRKASTLSEEEVSKDSLEGKEIVNEEIDDMKGSVETDTNGLEEFMGDMGVQRGNVEEALEISTKASSVNDEGQWVSEEEKQNGGEEIENIKENLKVTITTEESKEELGIQRGNVEEALEISTKASAVNDEGQLHLKVFEEEKQNVGEEIEDIKENLKVTITTEESKEELRGNVEEALEISSKTSAVNDEGQLVSEEKQNGGEEIENIKENLKVTITTEESKEELGNHRGNVEEALEISSQTSAVNDEGQLVSEEEKQNGGEEIENIKENLEVTITTEESKEELGIQKGTESTDGKILQNVEEILEMGAKACAVNYEGQLVSNKEEQSVAEEIEDMKERLEVATNITVEETKEELVFHKDHGIGKNIQNVGETLEMRTSEPVENAKGELGSAEGKEIIIEDTKDIRETVEVGTTIAVDVKGELVSQEVKKSLDEEVGKGNTILVKCVRSFVEKSVAELGSKEVKEYVNEETTDMEQPAAEVNSNMIAEEANKYLGLQAEKESMEEEVDDAKETSEMGIRIAIENVEGELIPSKEQANMDVEVETLKENMEKRTKASVEAADGKLGSQEETKGTDEETEDLNVPGDKVKGELASHEGGDTDEETEDLNVPGDKVKGELASHEGGDTDEEMKDAVESWEVSRSGCTTDSQEKTEDEVISAKEILEASETACVEEAKEDKSFAPVPKTPMATRSKILFMGNLPYSIDRQNVLSFFEDVGNVTDIRMAKNADGSMKGFCHVTFATAAAAVKALEKNGEIFHNRNVKLDLAENLRNKHVVDSTVLVRGLERSQSEEDIRKSLMKYFGECGSIKNIHVPKDVQAGDTRRVAFIRFEDSEAVSKAVKLCGREFGDSKLFVKEVGRSRFRRKSSNAKRRNSRRQVTN